MPEGAMTSGAGDWAESAGTWLRATMGPRPAACAAMQQSDAPPLGGSLLAMARQNGFFSLASKKLEIRLPSDAFEFDSDNLSPRPHEPPSGYRGWYMLKLGES
mmetsp:Transcript_24156/g.57537  ORF Transcript_24156/g.57537 Transcript_24156/m.57537 type:complete len:103 (+) Transcript_24156:248-556(+)